MDTESKREWMEENDVRHCSRWVKFNGEYNGEYDFCDVRTEKGDFGPCCNTGHSFTDMLSEDECIIPYEDVVFVRYYESTITDDEADDEENEGEYD